MQVKVNFFKESLHKIESVNLEANPEATVAKVVVGRL
jgi:hypothetical protein